ncbi:ABC transporter permease subunit [Bacillus sp. RG28]|uniref:ABC transporter permease subunit n=1 Tax=Gottfriedia endophytica TaxID=2820819 RepID=A0A940NV55_9BACI|nr:ABC transporter permease subunit [Gottfriedia endophytica]MBP0725473.1 ABC transporter permease subunit [Gottfriedia endophytica]
MKFVLKKFVSLLCIYVSIFLLLLVPFYFSGFKGIPPLNLTNLLHPFSINYVDFNTKRKIFVLPLLLDKYSYSMTLLFVSFIIAIICATFLNYLFEISSSRIRKFIRSLLDVFESVPEVMLVMLLQIGIASIFMATGYLVADIVVFGEERTYLLPIICLSIVPTIYLFRMMVLETENQRIQPYVEFAISKGFSKTYILFRHMFPNIIINLLNYSRSIFLFMLSNLIIIEILFNIQGYMNAIRNYYFFTFDICLIWFFLLVTPFYIINTVFLFIASKWSGGEVID